MPCHRKAISANKRRIARSPGPHRGDVCPLIGCDSMVPSGATERNSSGDEFQERDTLGCNGSTLRDDSAAPSARYVSNGSGVTATRASVVRQSW
jgi:hypothetical protein